MARISSKTRKPPGGSRAPETAGSAIDKHIGSRLRLRRTALGLSQQKVAESAGITSQQIQKYEGGVDRIGAGRLYVFANFLGVPPAFFFEGLPEAARAAHAPASGKGGRLAAKDGVPSPQNADMPRETFELMRSYNAVRDEAMRKAIRDLVRLIAGT